MTDFAELRERLVSRLRESAALRDDRVAQAVLTVPRHIFLPGVEPERAYEDDAIVTKSDERGRAISSSSQPAIMTIMLEQLDVQPGHRVLEIGAGTGYNAALLAHLTGVSGSVTTVDVDDDIAAAAREHLAAGGYDRVSVVHGDGGLGWLPGAPYDRIIATVGVSDILPAWLDQLAEGGRLVLPLAIRSGAQYSVAFHRVADHLESRSIRPCGFMRLRGAFAAPEAVSQIAEGVFAETAPKAPGAEELPALLDQPGESLDSGIMITLMELGGSLGLWLVATEPGIGRLSVLPSNALPAPLSLLFSTGRMATVLLMDEHGCAALIRTAVPGPSEDDDSEAAKERELARRQKPFPCRVQAFGATGAGLAARFVRDVHDWDAAGRPGVTDFTISAYPLGTAVPGGHSPVSGAVIDKQYTRLLLSWRNGTGTAGKDGKDGEDACCE